MNPAPETDPVADMGSTTVSSSESRVALEQRVAFLEGRVVEQAGQLDRTNESIARLETRMDTRFDQVEKRMDTRFDQVDRRFEQLESRMSRQFMWLVGMHVATLVTVVGALVAR